MASIKDTWLDWYADRQIEEGVTSFVKRLLEAKVRRLLDFGTGTGRHTVYLAKMGFEVYGFDWSEAAIELTKRELSKEGLWANLAVWDMNDLPLPYDDSFFDAVLAVKVLHHTYLEKITGIAYEIGRITREGGFVYVDAPAYEEVMRQKREGLKFDEPEPNTFIPLNGDEIGVPHHHFTRDEFLNVFGNFKLISFEERNEHYCFTGLKK
jgi:SAM-dependent methyltransferase